MLHGRLEARVLVGVLGAHGGAVLGIVALGLLVFFLTFKETGEARLFGLLPFLLLALEHGNLGVLARLGSLLLLAGPGL